MGDVNWAKRRRLDALLGRPLYPDELAQAQALAESLGVRLRLVWWRLDLRTGRWTCLNGCAGAADESQPTLPDLKTVDMSGSIAIPTR